MDDKQQKLKEDAEKLAEILIQLRKDYPLFLQDIAPDDPDLDMNRGFKCFEKLQAKKHPYKLDVARYLNHYQITHRIKQENGSTLFCLDCCVFDNSHRDNAAAIIQSAEGKLIYKCLYNSCKGRRWNETRERISGGDKLISFIDGVRTCDREQFNRKT